VGRLVIWRGLHDEYIEAARIDLSPNGLGATGTQIGTDPLHYRLEYTLEADRDFITRHLSVEADGDGWSRSVQLAHDGSGRWELQARNDGDVDLPPPGGTTTSLNDARDCDLGFSPVTNLMPIRRHALHQRLGSVDLLAAWVSVPDLGIVAYRQRYESVSVDAAGAVVRFTSLDTHEGFTSELELDRDGLVLLYPGLARRAGR
jgi:hypothetical protein